MRRGKLVVMEGLDRSGKSTQCVRLVTNLEKQGHKVRHMRFPDRTTPIGQMISNYLAGQSEQEDHVIHLLFSANRWEAAASIEAAIAAGTSVVIDRYYYSGCVYSAAKQNPSLPLSWSRHPEVGLPRPDVCIFLEISAEDASKRGGFGAERYESRTMQARVRDLYSVFEKSGEKDGLVKINAGLPMEEVEQAVLHAALKTCEEVDAGELPLRKVEEW